MVGLAGIQILEEPVVDRSIGRATASIEIDFVPTDSGRRSRNSEQHYNMDLSLFRREKLFEFLSRSIFFPFFLASLGFERKKMCQMWKYCHFLKEKLYSVSIILDRN